MAEKDSEERLVIDVTRVKEGGETLQGLLDDSILDMSSDPYVRPFAGIRYRLDMQAFGDELLVRGVLEQDFDAVCSRCGADFDFTAKVTDFAVSAKKDEKTGCVDLTDEGRQSIILALPNYPVCRADCRGVCARCGKNLNEGPCGCVPEHEDVRWNGLDGFKA